MRTVGPYRILREIDHGPLSTVYQVEHGVLGTRHALKLAAPDVDPPILEALLLSARLQARTLHPNLVRVTDAGHHEGRPYLVSDWVEGRTLADWLDAHGAMPLPTALALFRGIVRGVHALHQAGIVHRDLKPSNVLLGEVRGRTVPMINDLGLAKECLPNERAVPAGLSRAYRTLGTPEYMAPEQAANVAAVDGRADLWSLGVLFYELLSNAVPFEAESPWATLVAARVGRYPPLRERVAQVPPAVEALVRDLLRVEVDERIQSASALLRRLDDLG